MFDSYINIIIFILWIVDCWFPGNVQDIFKYFKEKSWLEYCKTNHCFVAYYIITLIIRNCTAFYAESFFFTATISNFSNVMMPVAVVNSDFYISPKMCVLYIIIYRSSTRFIEFMFTLRLPFSLVTFTYVYHD